jgi:hypothetical protein
MPILNIMQTLAALQKSTVAARERLGDKTIGTQAKDGKVQVIRVTYDAGGKSAVVPVSDWMLPTEAAAFLDGMK